MSRSDANILIAAGMLLASLLSGCASSPSQNVEAKVSGHSGSMPADARADFDEAMRLMKSEQYQKGVVLLDRVVTKSQNNAIPYINLAIAQGKLGDLKNAEENLKLALALEPDNPVANNEYALIFRKTGRFAEARQVYEGMLQKYPNYPMAHKNLAILCDIYLRDYACALKGYEAYSNAMPADKTTKIWIADVQKRMGNK